MTVTKVSYELPNFGTAHLVESDPDVAKYEADANWRRYRRWEADPETRTTRELPLYDFEPLISAAEVEQAENWLAAVSRLAKAFDGDYERAILVATNLERSARA